MDILLRQILCGAIPLWWFQILEWRAIPNGWYTDIGVDAYKWNQFRVIHCILGQCESTTQLYAHKIIIDMFMERRVNSAKLIVLPDQTIGYTPCMEFDACVRCKRFLRTSRNTIAWSIRYKYYYSPNKHRYLNGIGWGLCCFPISTFIHVSLSHFHLKSVWCGRDCGTFYPRKSYTLVVPYILGIYVLNAADCTPSWYNAQTRTLQ